MRWPQYGRGWHQGVNYRGPEKKEALAERGLLLERTGSKITEIEGVDK